jgi:hypothetical protein
MSRSGNTGATIMVSQVEIQSQIDAQKELLSDFKGNPRCTCTRCSSVFQLKDETKEYTLMNHLRTDGCPFCSALKYTSKELNAHQSTNFQIKNELIETLRLPNKTFKRAKTINGKWFDAKPKASKGPHSMGIKSESQKLSY